MDCKPYDPYIPDWVLLKDFKKTEEGDIYPLNDFGFRSTGIVITITEEDT